MPFSLRSSASWALAQPLVWAALFIAAIPAFAGLYATDDARMRISVDDAFSSSHRNSLQQAVSDVATRVVAQRRIGHWKFEPSAVIWVDSDEIKVTIDFIITRTDARLPSDPNPAAARFRCGLDGAWS